MKLPHPHIGRNSLARIIQRKPTRHPDIQIPTVSSPHNCHVTPHTRTRMAHPNVQNLEKQPHPAPSHTKEDNTYHPRQIEYDITRSTTPTTRWKVQEKTSKRKGLERGKGLSSLEKLAYKGPGVIEPHMDGPIAQPV